MGRTKDAESGGFLHKLAWTVFVSLVVSLVGLAVLHYLGTTGETPLVDVSSAAGTTAPSAASGSSDDSTTESKGTSRSESTGATADGEQQPDETSSEGSSADSFFSFHDRLSGAPPAQENASDGDGRNAEEAARFTLQVGAHPSLESARRQMQQIDRVGLEPWVIATEGTDGDEYYRVHVGKFASSDEARDFRERLRKNRGLHTHLAEL